MDTNLPHEYILKKEQAMKEIVPICNVFGIQNVDYKIDPKTLSEKLCIGTTEIGCTGNSIMATVDELIAYIFVNRYCKHRDLGVFHTQTVKHIKRYWIKE